MADEVNVQLEALGKVKARDLPPANVVALTMVSSSSWAEAPIGHDPGDANREDQSGNLLAKLSRIDVVRCPPANEATQTRIVLDDWRCVRVPSAEKEKQYSCAANWIWMLDVDLGMAVKEVAAPSSELRSPG